MNYARTASDGGTGFRYETKITALFALRLNNYFVNFHLASNFHKGGKFDDIVFALDHDQQWKTWFIQLKHRLPTTLNKKKIDLTALTSRGDFGLKYYFDSYKAIAQKFSRHSRDPIFSKDFRQVRFAIFTNAILSDELLKKNHSTVECSILSTNPGLEQNIMLDLEEDEKVFEKLSKDWYIQEFVGRLFFFTRQASESEIDNLIQQEIKLAVTDLKSRELKLLAHEWVNYIQQWATRAQFLEKDEVQATLLRLSREAQYGKRDNDTSIKFLNSFLKFQDGQLEGQLVCLQTDADCTMMAMSAFKQMGLLDEPNLLVHLRNLEHEDELQHLSTTWHRYDDIVLTIDCEGDNLGINTAKIVRNIMKLLQSARGNRIILMATKSNATATNISIQLNAKSRKFNCSLKNLTDESKAMLKEREVIFQGYQTPLASLMKGRALDDVFDMAAITQLLQGRVVNIGLKPVEKIPYYVTRLLTRQSTVTESLFQDQRVKATYALTGISYEDASKVFGKAVMKFSDVSSDGFTTVGKFVILDIDPESAFIELSNKTPNALHWFERHKRDGKLWHWKKSSKAVRDIMGHIHHLREFVPTDNFMAINEKIVVITAEPGMGKSTLLQHLAAETKKCTPHMWVICLAVNDFTDHFDREDFIRNIHVNTKNIIANAAGVDKETSKFDARLFNQCYDVTGHMIVLLDGFDEIAPYFTRQGLAFLRALNESCVSGIWVTARPVLRDILETDTLTLSYTIKPFVLKDQRNFLKKYWKHSFPDVDEESLGKFIERVLKLVNESFDQKLAQFTGIPLQTRMVAEVFTEDLNTFRRTGTLEELSQTLDAVQLFDSFIKIKRGIQMEKSKLPASARWEAERLNEQREKELMKLALLTLLPRNVCSGLSPPIGEENVQELKDLVNNGQEKSGIVVSFKGESPQFIHRTFAEYFVALFLARNYASNRRFMSSDTFFSLPFEFVKYFFDAKLVAGCQLHLSVLRREIEVVKNMVRKGMDLNAVDGGGRTAMHLAASMANAEEVINLLLNQGSSIDVCDDVLQQRPIDYAMRAGRVENVAQLLEISKEKLDDNSIEVSWNNLQLAAKGDYVNFFEYLLYNGLYDVEPLHKLTPQKWLDENKVYFNLNILHLIAAYNSMKILQYLLDDQTSKEVVVLLFEKQNDKGMTPLLQAAAAGHGDLANLLVTAGADPLAKSTMNGKDLATCAIEGHLLNFICDVMTTTPGLNPVEFLSGAVAALISDKSDWACQALEAFLSIFPEVLAVKTAKNEPLLVAAAMKGNEKMVRMLCGLSADVNETAGLGPALHYAVLRGHEGCVRALLESHALNIDAVDGEGCTAVFRAVLKGNEKIFLHLARAKANLKIVTHNGSDLTHAFAESSHPLSSIFFYLFHSSSLDFHRPNRHGHSSIELLRKRGLTDFVAALDSGCAPKTSPQKEWKPKPTSSHVTELKITQPKELAQASKEKPQNSLLGVPFEFVNVPYKNNFSNRGRGRGMGAKWEGKGRSCTELNKDFFEAQENRAPGWDNASGGASNNYNTRAAPLDARSSRPRQAERSRNNDNWNRNRGRNPRSLSRGRQESCERQPHQRNYGQNPNSQSSGMNSGNMQQNVGQQVRGPQPRRGNTMRNQPSAPRRQAPNQKNLNNRPDESDTCILQ